jgi:hypothetical protein
MPLFLFANKCDSNYYFVAEAIRKGVSKADFPSSCICGARGAKRSYTPYVQWIASGFVFIMTGAVGRLCELSYSLFALLKAA